MKKRETPSDPWGATPGFWSDLFAFARKTRKWWLLPLILILVAVGLLAVFMSASALQPFIYTLF